MWERLRQADIALAKQQLRQRVDETLLRHVEELKRLDGEQTELEALTRLLDEFSRKFKGGASAAPVARVAEAPLDVEAAPPEAKATASGPAEAEPEPAAADAAEAAPAESAEAATAAAEPAAAEAVPEAEEAADAAKATDTVAKANRAAADKTPPKGRNTADQRDRDRDPNQRPKQRTNFDAFSQAMAKIDRW